MRAKHFFHLFVNLTFTFLCPLLFGPTALPPVSLLSVLSVTYASVTLSWRAPEVDGFVDDYTVCYTPTVLAAPTETLQDCTSSYPSQHYITSGNNATVSGLEQGVEYLFLVQYSYQNRLGNVSAPLNATTNSSECCFGGMDEGQLRV